VDVRRAPLLSGTAGGHAVTLVFAGLALGIAGSGHCAAMCGPLLLALRQHAAPLPASAAAARGLAYHAGRVAVYSALGFLAGTVGRIAVLGGLRRALAIAAGASLILSAAGRLGSLNWAPQRMFTGIISRGIARGVEWMRVKGVSAPLAFGALNGLLPCGLVYGAMTTAMAVGRPWDAALFMAAFGIGTTPSLLVVWVASRAMPAPIRARLRFAAPLALAVAGLLLIARGAGLPALQHGDAHTHVHAAE
jgi:sulfite exporter TauE/SafE